MKKDYWLIIEPYTYISILQNNAILYNTINGEYLKYSDKDNVLRLLKEIDLHKNLYIVKINNNELLNDEIKDFIQDVRNCFMGDIISTNSLSNKPFQFRPISRIQESIVDLQKDNSLTNKLTLLNIYLNNTPENQNCISDIYSYSYKQFVSPIKKGKSYTELNIDVIRKILQEIEKANVSQLNILGGELSRYLKLNEVIELLKDASFKKVVCTDYTDILNFPSELLKTIVDYGFELNIFVHFPINRDLLSSAFSRFIDIIDSINVIFIIQGENDYSTSLKLVANYNFKNHEFVPFYNGYNIDFFEENIFIDEEDIFDSIITLKEIFARQYVNPISYGNLTILFNGKVYSNLNKKSIGHISQDSIKQIIDKELLSERSWMKSRSKVKICNKCVLNCFCPPVSDYEYVIGKHNLCHIPSM